MFNRKELKLKAKLSMKANYWRSVGAALVTSIALGGGFATVASSSQDAETKAQITQAVSGISAHQLLIVVGLIFGVYAFVATVSTLINIFVRNPILVGCCKFFESSCEQGGTKLGTLLHGFKSQYLRNVGTMFLSDLYIVLWGLLLIIPGVVKAYSYRMVPYILADRPELDHKEVITLSRQMMDGNKWASFVMDLSFIGWHLLSLITLGIVGIFYTAPYVEHADAALYLELKKQMNA